MDRLELANQLASLPQADLTQVLGIADFLRNGAPTTVAPKFAYTGKKRGRRKGSKNKPKPQHEATLAPAPAGDFTEADYLPS